MRRLSLGKTAVGFLLRGMDQVRELNGILDEEDRDVVAHQIPVSFLGVELGGKTSDVSGQVGGPFVARHRREADEDGGALPSPLKQVCSCQLVQRFVVLEESMSAVATGVDYSFWNAFVIEVEDLLSEVEVLEKSGPALTCPQRVLVVGHDHTLLGCERLICLTVLMCLAAWTHMESFCHLCS